MLRAEAQPTYTVNVMVCRMTMPRKTEPTHPEIKNLQDLSEYLRTSAGDSDTKFLSADFSTEFRFLHKGMAKAFREIRKIVEELIDRTEPQEKPKLVFYYGGPRAIPGQVYWLKAGKGNKKMDEGSVAESVGILIPHETYLLADLDFSQKPSLLTGKGANDTAVLPLETSE